MSKFGCECNKISLYQRRIVYEFIKSLTDFNEDYKHNHFKDDYIKNLVPHNEDAYWSLNEVEDEKLRIAQKLFYHISIITSIYADTLDLICLNNEVEACLAELGNNKHGKI